ncbi:MAG: hypothetical protein MZV63_31155 [Marinilabiliales bacterium]|nr:hypothetical protein [Marinilabiliales bacterium]
MMYSNLSDTAPRTVLPAYISKPDASGGFLISNIKPGRFRLYALKDLNGNKMYDLEDEAFAYLRFNHRHHPGCIILQYHS